ncbi:hypothetical protein BDN67DRAFT_977911 [Paxillus ammoniavirescens]|nr:hypothetical protein BDN67DRAFT_977911 [Paxillus ammoniavirescens]
MAGSCINVALVGITGVGKSTLVNILKGSEVARANNDTNPCTLEATPYEVVDSGTTYRIWDTRGLNEASWKVFSWLPWVSNDANAQLKNLLRGNNSTKIDVVLLCIERAKIQIASHWGVHTEIPTNIKVAVVVTRMGIGDIGSSEWKGTCKDAANRKGVVLNTNLVEGVPMFTGRDFQEQKIKDCRGKILALISRCRQ